MPCHREALSEAALKSVGTRICFKLIMSRPPQPEMSRVPFL